MRDMGGWGYVHTIVALKLSSDADFRSSDG